MAPMRTGKERLGAWGKTLTRILHRNLPGRGSSPGHKNSEEGGAAREKSKMLFVGALYRGVWLIKIWPEENPEKKIRKESLFGGGTGENTRDGNFVHGNGGRRVAWTVENIAKNKGRPKV